MNPPTNSPSSKNSNASRSPFALPQQEEVPNALRLTAEARELSEIERRYLFRELAKELLDPNSDEIGTLCDNEGNVLGYFEPALHHFRESAKRFSSTARSREDILEGSVPAREFLEQALR